ncbi:hypothetical protein OH687_04365 [Burkholderia anthina]|nr:hypothetical protein OH687_04365 [Burkholderia anthina]
MTRAPIARRHRPEGKEPRFTRGFFSSWPRAGRRHASMPI